MKFDQQPKLMWKPSAEKAKKSLMRKFRDHVNKKFDLKLDNYQDLWKWSTTQYESFWEMFWHFSGIKYSKPFTQVLDKHQNIADIPEWFHGSHLNYAENLLRGADDDVAIYFAGEQRKLEKITFSSLRENVRKLACALKSFGVEKGDRVVGYIANCPAAIEAMLATASLGAIWSSTSPEFGVSGVLDRFQQVKAKVIFSVDSVIYNGKTHDHLEKLTNVVNGLPDLEKVILIPYVKCEKDINITNIRNCEFLSTFLKEDTGDALCYTQVPFNHPLFIMYSSGTTGAPKCIVHSVGSTLLQHMKEHMLHGNMNKTDIMLYYTTTGWMMWNWLVSSLALGSAIVLYDGSPLMPKPDVLWDLIDTLGITILGTGARWIEALEEKSIFPMKSHTLSSLHTILSTGSPLKPSSYDYVYTSIKKDVLLASITGGTDIISCFAGSNPVLPVYRGEIQSCNLGMAMYSWDDQGKAVYNTAGELVCTAPFPSMPIYFWNDTDNIRYQKSYFQKFKGVWSHGDYCEISSSSGGVLMLGRSDGTLNPNGVRFGSAEIYNIVNSTHVKEVQDSLCVAQNTNDGERVVLFIKLAATHVFDMDLVKRIKTLIRQHLSARHVPSHILPITDIPYTASGKKVEVAVKRILNGEHIHNRGALTNPDSLDLYYNITELKL